MSWPGSTIKTKFEGTSVAILLADSKVHYPDANYLDVFIDGVSIGPIYCNSPNDYYLLKDGLKDTVHTLEIFKRTDGMPGPITFKGIILDDYKKLIEPMETTDFKIEFYGDSIIAGSCNEAPVYSAEEIAKAKDKGLLLTNDPYDNFSTYNNYFSFPAIAARNLNAEYVCIAQGGVGLTNGEEIPDYIMPDLWDIACSTDDWKLNDPLDRSQLWDFKTSEPAYVVVSLGGNDVQHGIKGDFKAQYINFIHNLREKYPNATFFCVTTPPRFNIEGTTATLTKEAVKDLNAAGDSNIFYYTFKNYTDYTNYVHPRVSQHLELADELTQLIQNHIASNVTVDYNVGANYSSGADIDFTITNNNDFPIHNWQVNFSLPKGEHFSKVWKATVNQNEEQLTFQNLSWNSTIPAHESISFGLEVAHNNASNFTLDDIQFSLQSPKN